ncbi:MAG: hypothetical protein MRZ79_17210 [Bacteroidia bacterium]|nr:hypothetical protein [Bacteroidia bacterium]
MNRVIVILAIFSVALLQSCQVNLEEEFVASVEGNWEIVSITLEDKNQTINFDNFRPLMEFSACERNEVMCPALITDQNGNIGTYEFRGEFETNDKTNGNINLIPNIADFATNYWDTLQISDRFTFILEEDTLLLSGGIISSFQIGPEISDNASLKLVREP